MAQQPDNPSILMIALHDAGENPTSAAERMRWETHRPDWLILYPQLNFAWSGYLLDAQQTQRELNYIHRLYRSMKRRYPSISTLYLAGEGTGGALALDYAALQPEVNAVVAHAVRGYRVKKTQTQTSSLLLSHGVHDTHMPLMGGHVTVNGQIIDVPPAITPALQWAKGLGCSDHPQQGKLDEHIKLTRFQNCADRKKVDYFSVDGIRREWQNERGWDFTPLALDFLRFL